MEHPGFFDRAGPMGLGAILDATGDALPPGADPAMRIVDVKPLERAGAGDLSFFDNPKYLPQFTATHAVACFVSKRYADKAPAGTIAVVSGQPYRSFALALGLFYPQAVHPLTARGEGSEAVHPSAMLEDGAKVESGAIVGPQAHIGRGTTIAAGAVVGYRVHVGRNSYVGPGAVVTHALIGDGVTIHANVSIGQDGFGFAMGGQGHVKVPQIGRVIVQDGVEIGANTAIDRGSLGDTIVGEGTKIDNLVQIGHNVVIGRHCIVVAQTGISGSAVLEDFVVLGGQVGVVGHVRIGKGAQIAGSSNVRGDVPAGAKWGGTPARPVRTWFREMTALKKLAEQPGAGHTKTDASDPGGD